MNTQNSDNILLALLLALKASEISLSATETSDILKATKELDLQPLAWDEDIKPPLLKMIQANDALDKHFQLIKSQIENLGYIPRNLLPTEIELSELKPTELVSRAVPDISGSDLKSNEITNMVMRAILTPNSSEAIKKINKLDELLQFFSQQIAGK